MANLFGGCSNATLGWERDNEAIKNDEFLRICSVFSRLTTLYAPYYR